MRIPDAIAEHVRDKFSVLTEAVPKYGPSVDPSLLQDEIGARTRLADFLEQDIPEAINAAKERLNVEWATLDRELRETLHDLGFVYYAPDRHEHERPTTWSGWLENDRMTAIRTAQRTLDEFARVDVPRAKREAEEIIRGVRQRLARMKLANAN